MIVRDEADHGGIAWEALDWVLLQLSAEERHSVRSAADHAVLAIETYIRNMAKQTAQTADDAHQCGWLLASEFGPIALASLENRVLPQLRQRELLASPVPLQIAQPWPIAS